MNSAELVNAISCPPIWPSVKRFLISNWWIGSAMPHLSVRFVPQSPIEARQCLFVSPDTACRHHPAARITLSTPAANPSSRNTIIPHGEIPSQRSSSQPNIAPTRTPATSSVESRKPRAIAEGSATGRAPGSLSDSLPSCVEPSRSPRRPKPRGESGFVGGPVLRSHSCRARRRPCFRHPRYRRVRMSRRPQSRADHTQGV